MEYGVPSGDAANKPNRNSVECQRYNMVNKTATVTWPAYCHHITVLRIETVRDVGFRSKIRWRVSAMCVTLRCQSLPFDWLSFLEDSKNPPLLMPRLRSKWARRLGLWPEEAASKRRQRRQTINGGGGRGDEGKRGNENVCPMESIGSYMTKYKRKETMITSRRPNADTQVESL